MKKSIIFTSLILALSLTGCTSSPVIEKSTLKACELQADLFKYGINESDGSLESAKKLHDMAVEVANTAEDADALPFFYQVDFFAAMADPNTTSDWNPSKEMAASNGQIANICQKLGITF